MKVESDSPQGFPLCVGCGEEIDPDKPDSEMGWPKTGLVFGKHWHQKCFEGGSILHNSTTTKGKL